MFHALQLWFSYPPMAQKRILIGTPLKGDLPKSYFRTSLQLAAMEISNVKLDWILLDGPAVQIARCEIALHAMEERFDELIFWDKDVVAERNEEDVTTAAFLRLMSHDRDIVTAVYSARSLKTHWHVHVLDGEQPDETGLQKVKRASIGFCKIKVPVLRKIAEDNPDRIAVRSAPNSTVKMMPELFPMELKGKNTPAHRIEQIAAALSEVKNDNALRARIERELTIRYDESNSYISEDFGFCDLARASGYDIWMDTMMVLGHQTNVTVPISSAKLLEMLSEPWRKEELAVIKQQMLEAQAAKKK